MPTFIPQPPLGHLAGREVTRRGRGAVDGTQDALFSGTTRLTSFLKNYGVGHRGPMGEGELFPSAKDSRGDDR